MPVKRTPLKKLGLLGTGLVTVMQNHLWQGAIQAAQTHGVRLIYYPTVGLGSFPAFVPSSQILFDFVDRMHLDGLLIWYAGVAEGVTEVQERDFFDRYQELPVVTIGGQLSHYPDLSIDNYQGVRAAVEHLIQIHGRQHVGIIRGPTGHPDADERYRSCVETLHAYNLPVNPDHVVETLFAIQVASDTTQAAITRWLKSPNPQLDAVITASDYMALAAIQAVEACGLRVPEDIAVVGFDDVSHAQSHTPTLTTVRQPFHEMGYRAIEMLLALIDGQALPHRNLMPAPLIVRESCGCIPKSLEMVDSVIEVKSSPYAVTSPIEQLENKLNNLARDADFPVDQVMNLADFLKGDFSLETSQQFLTTLRSLLLHGTITYFDAVTWQNAISALRNYALSSSDIENTPSESLFNQAHILITEVHQHAYIKQRIEAEEQLENLRHVSEALIASFGKQLLFNTIREQLPMLGFASVYLSLYENSEHPETWSTLILAYQNRQQLDLPPEGIRFPTKQLVPSDLLPANSIAPLVVEPLYFGTHQLGMLVLEVGPSQGTIYETLRAQISSALQGSMLLQQVQDHATQLEERVASRTHELKQAVEQLKKEIAEREQAEAAQRKSEEMAHEFQEKLKILQEISLELVSTESLEQLCINAVELGHSALGYDRLGLLLFENEEQTIASRFGIESNRELHIERHVAYPVQNDSLMLSGVLANHKSVYVSEDAVLGDFDHAVGRGWNIVTGIWDGNTSIGWLAADNYLDKKPLIPYQVELLNLYGATIGHLVTRKRAEAEIRRLNDELEQRVIERTAELQTAHDHLQVLSRAKDDFVSNVSHELRTPITNIKLYHTLLDQRPEKSHHYLTILRRETNRLESLIEALLMLSRLDQNREKVSFVLCDLNVLLQQFISDREVLASAHNITLALELGTEPVVVEADQRLLEQVLSILFTNALTYTPPGGYITVRLLEQVTNDDDWVGFSVSDTGAGIAQDEQTHLFERFFRGKAGHDSQTPGTGLGLSIAKEIIDLHQGHIEIFSGGIGHGATFSVWLTSK